MTLLSQTPPLPTFELPDTSGAPHRPGDAPVTVVVFTSNRCPFALAWHDRLIAVARDYADAGARVLLVNANAPEVQIQDSYEAMQERFAAEDWGPVPYLRDENQEVARAFGAETTPDVFVLDAELRLRYRGAPDADCEEPVENAAWLREAIDDVLAGREVQRTNTFSVGCPIKWRS
jgi:protein-disulfide isomerase